MSVCIDLAGKTVIITGAGSGIGFATVKIFQNAGATVIANDIKDVNDMITLFDEKTIYVQADISSEVGAKELIQKAVSATGRLDCLINNAGVAADWDVTLNVNVKGPYFCSMEALKYLKVGGRIIFIGSASSETGGTSSPQYVASKGGMNSLMRFLAKNYSSTGVRINSISPAVVKTEFLRSWFETEEMMEEKYGTQIPIGRMGDPEDIGNIALFLASNLSDYLQGQIIIADGGRFHIG